MSLQTGQLGLLLVVARFELFQLADLRAEHRGLDLGLLGGLIVDWRDSGFSRRSLGDGLVEQLLCIGRSDTQFGDLAFQLRRRVGGELLLGLFQGDLSHAGFDLELLLLLREAGLLCLNTSDRVILAVAGAAFGLCRLGASRSLGTGLAVGLFLLFGAPQAFLA